MGCFHNKSLKYVSLKPQGQVGPRRALRILLVSAGWTQRTFLYSFEKRQPVLCSCRKFGKTVTCSHREDRRVFNVFVVMAKEISRQNVKSINFFYL